MDALILAMRSGLLPPGSPIPGTRKLADQLQVSRGTVVAAFEELQAKGWIDASSGSGSRVSDPLPRPLSLRPGQTPPVLSPQAFDLPTRPELATDHTSRLFKLSYGVTDARLMSAEILGRAYSRAMRRRASDVLNFGDPLGEMDLRQELVNYLRERRAIQTDEMGILVTRGSHQALRLIALGLLKAGDRVAVENPGNPSARDAFLQQQTQLVPIPVDDQGLDVEALERALAEGPIRLLYLTPRFQVPTTVTQSAPRRQRLLELAKHHRFGIVEDDPEADYTLEGPTEAPLAAFGTSGSVLYLFSFSRLLAPGLRLGLIAGPKDAIARLAKARLHTDTLGDMALERAFASMLQEGEIRRHVHRVQRIYRERRDHLVYRLKDLFEGDFTFTLPPGGLSLWIRTRPDLDLESWQRGCMDRGVQFQLGQSYFINHTPVPGFPFAFGSFEPEEMDQILLRMHHALTQHR
ncbi:PLP-dependent aminotransferase family protein [Geothrix sp. PMB-07]|uniref:aminotransferase-like domain-containing protein n=1 Tax=Geothrix sp. PMB-07 TaxID=3068640 RepID=UPI002740F118|nr:PLP-dependent aminotransferase family protein [Geothrix sp. PMB-07]WLT30999.1 PLP-dependent aminotransferase family protein [Geothrix sp. PMB-07]